MTTIANENNLVDIDAREPVEFRRKRLTFRAWHRGTREMDILVGKFADRYAPTFDQVALDQFEAMLTCNDPDVYDWYIGTTPVPDADKSPVVDLFLKFKLDAVE